MSRERRSDSRFEPRSIRARVMINKHNPGKSLTGIVIDASQSGMAIITRTGKADLFQQGEAGNVKVCNAITDEEGVNLGLATIVRSWTNNRDAGVAIKLDSPLPGEMTELLLSGPRKNVRVENQAILADLDMDKIHSHVQALHDCQLKLLILAITIGTTIGGLYLTLAYHSAILGPKHPQADELSYWRMWVAMLPGLLSISIASVVLQKISSVARNEAFLSVLKECRISGRYPREYWGWEDAYRKLKFCKKSKLCDNCKQGSCGEFSVEERKLYDDLKLTWKSVPNVFHLVVFSILGLIGFLSLLAITNEVLKYKLENGTVLVLGIIFGAILVLLRLYGSWSPIVSERAGIRLLLGEECGLIC